MNISMTSLPHVTSGVSGDISFIKFLFWFTLQPIENVVDKNVADRRLLKDHFHKSRVKISAMDSNYYHFFPFFPL